MHWMPRQPNKNVAGAEIIRQAIEHYLENYEDLSISIERLRDPNDPVLDWEKVKMSCSVKIKRSAQKELIRITKSDRERIVAAIDHLAENPLLVLY